MPARRRRKLHPSKPNRDRTRSPGGRMKNNSIPPVAMTGRGSGAYDREMLDTTRGNPSTPGSAAAARGRYNRLMSMETWEAIERSQHGDDSELLPYQPTPSINPPRPRTKAAGYDPETQTLRVRFRDGTPWAYYNVPKNVWRNFRRSKSPGRFINRVLNGYEYSRDDF